MQFLREKINPLIRKIPLLEIIVFINGAIVMIVELLASRILAPYFGTSSITWTAIIAVLLGALSFGYWLGGRLSSKIDMSKTKETLGLVFIGAATALFTATLLNNHILEVIRLGADVRVNSIIGALVLFGAPVALMGIVSPFAVSIGIHQLSDKESGPFIGRMYSLGTVGSILGTFLGGFLLISMFGTTVLLYACAGILVLLGLLLVTWPMRAATLIGIVLAMLLPAFMGMLFPATFADIDTLYGRIWVMDGTRNGRDIRVLQINAEFSSAVYPENPLEPVFNYTKSTYLTDVFVENPKRILVLGGGAMTMPSHLVQLFPDAHIDVIEIDAQLEEISRKYFYYQPSPNITLYNEDARTFVNNYSGEPYDVVFMDVYRSLYTIPFHLITKEAMNGISKLTAENGVVIANVISTTDKLGKEYMGSLYKSMQQDFPYAVMIPVENIPAEQPNNIIIIASKQDIEVKTDTYHPEAERFLSNIQVLEVPESSIEFTDDFAPVEKYSTQFITRTSR